MKTSSAFPNLATSTISVQNWDRLSTTSVTRPTWASCWIQGRAVDNRFLGWVANNLGLSWVGQLQSGRPYPLSTGDSSFGNGSRFFGAGNETQQRPNVLPDGTISVAGIGSAFGSNANFSPNSVTPCTNAGFSPAQCQALVNTFVAPNGASGAGPLDAITGDVVDFKLANGNVERSAARGSPFVKFDASLHKTFTVKERIKLDLRFDAFNVFNHSNWTSFNSNDVLTALPLALATDANGNITGPAPDFFTCTGCQRPNGTFVGTNGQALHLADLQHGRISKDFLNPIFNGLGDPASTDSVRRLQLSFHARF